MISQKKDSKIEYHTYHILVFGIVQGVGFRPFVSRIARDNSLKGSVANKGSYVEIFAQGHPAYLEQFLKDLRKKAPERSAILKIKVLEVERGPYREFEIIESEKEKGDIFVSPDIATCDKCKAELFDPKNPRYMHPFINCTACGPRVTILDAMPYDRERTSMKEFPMCPDCEKEYYDPASRRYDAQPVCCNKCGPVLSLLGRKEKKSQALTFARKAILEGKIIAIKGIGGFHLCCDANNNQAVSRLRTLKNRPDKPFAVMMKDSSSVFKYCKVEPYQMEVLQGHQKPIILLDKKKELAPLVAPNNPRIGVMLPYAPVHMLLFDYEDDIDFDLDALVMTSGNVSGAPICRTNEDAQEQLEDYCDYILTHNRKIRLRADDSVMDFYQEQPYMIRRSRGYAPLPVMVKESLSGQVLAMGGELKNTFCLGKNQLFYPSPYVGDMEDLRTVVALEESIQRMEELLEIRPSLVVCDLHPRYNTTMVAKERNLPLLQIQHHYAHVLSCMAENDLSSEEKVIGISFDGTGYGTDGTIWGGEILISDYDGFERAASIKPFLQVGGDIASKEGWRIAASMLVSLYGKEKAMQIAQQIDLASQKEMALIDAMAQKRINSIESTSAGRLFDAVSAILGICKKSTFEGQASTWLEYQAQEYEQKALCNEAQDTYAQDRLELVEPRVEEGRWILPTHQLLGMIVEEKIKGVDCQRLAYLFHEMLSRQIVNVCLEITKEKKLTSVVFTGGVFQNKLLLKLCHEKLAELEYKIYHHSLIPPNDGGLCLGQAIAGMYHLNKMGIDEKN